MKPIEYSLNELIRLMEVQKNAQKDGIMVPPEINQDIQSGKLSTSEANRLLGYPLFKESE